MSDIDKIVNKNDNIYSREYLYSQPDIAILIPIATYLIKKFVVEEWKNNLNDPWYVTQEYGVCSLLSSKVFSRDEKIAFIATTLNCNPILLHNDPDLPF